MSGMRTTVIMQDGVKLDEAKLKEAFNRSTVNFVSLEEKELAAPVVRYGLIVSGAT